MASKEKRKSGTECEGQAVSHINCNPFGQQKVLDVEKIEMGDTENLKWIGAYVKEVLAVNPCLS